MRRKITQEQLGALIGSFLGTSPSKDRYGDWYLQMGLELKSANGKFASEAHGSEPSSLDVVVKFLLSDKGNGNFQSLEMLCFAPVFPGKPYPLKLEEGQFPEAVRFCAQLPMHVVPHVRASFQHGLFYLKKDIECPGELPDEWLVTSWLKPNIAAAATAFMLIGKRFATVV